MRTDRFTKFLDALYTGYVNTARKYGFEPIGKRQWMARMRRWEW